jgi:hypothetical protein
VKNKIPANPTAAGIHVLTTSVENSWNLILSMKYRHVERKEQTSMEQYRNTTQTIIQLSTQRLRRLSFSLLYPRSAFTCTMYLLSFTHVVHQSVTTLHNIKLVSQSYYAHTGI